MSQIELGRIGKFKPSNLRMFVARKQWACAGPACNEKNVMCRIVFFGIGVAKRRQFAKCDGDDLDFFREFSSQGLFRRFLRFGMAANCIPNAGT